LSGDHGRALARAVGSGIGNRSLIWWRGLVERIFFLSLVFILLLSKSHADTESCPRGVQHCGNFEVVSVKKAQVMCIDYQNKNEKVSSPFYAEVDDCVLEVKRKGESKIQRVYVNKLKCNLKVGGLISIGFSDMNVYPFAPLQCPGGRKRKLSTKIKYTPAEKSIGANALLDSEYKEAK